MAPIPQSFNGVHLKWPIERTVLPFAVRVVEPRRFEPLDHTRILNAVVESLVRPPAMPIDRFDDVAAPTAKRRYDLVTFPEAFASVEAILDIARALESQGPSGCLHVGLRPDASSPNHLFGVPAMKSLVAELQKLVDPDIGDLSGFIDWLDHQDPVRVFNLGCVIAVDAKSRLRVCLHPKLVRSKFEVDRLPELHMTEANLLTLITLVPTNPLFGTVTIQPLICSDALDIGTDSRLPAPIPAVTQCADCIPDPPNHVDIVSIATCTPQPSGKSRDGSAYRVWHSQFLESFTAAAQNPDRARHHFAAFVLANYTDISSKVGGGLSGAFLPVPPGFTSSDPAVSVSCWGRHKEEPKPHNGWSEPDDQALTGWSSRGFVAGLDPFVGKAEHGARVLSFDVHRLPREASLWRREPSLVAWEVTNCVVNLTDDHSFEHRDLHA